MRDAEVSESQEMGIEERNRIRRSSAVKTARLTFVTNLGDVVTSHTGYVEGLMLQKARSSC